MTRSFCTRSFCAAAIFVLASSPAVAQGRRGAGPLGVRTRGNLPPGQRPPYGLCRIWIDGVAPGLQSNVTGCAYAYSNAPRNGRVIYGGERGELFGSRYDPYYYGREIRERDHRYDGHRDDDRYRDEHYCDDDRDSYRTGSRGRGVDRYREHDRGYNRTDNRWHDRGHDRKGDARGRDNRDRRGGVTSGVTKGGYGRWK